MNNFHPFPCLCADNADGAREACADAGGCAQGKLHKIARVSPQGIVFVIFYVNFFHLFPFFKIFSSNLTFLFYFLSILCPVQTMENENELLKHLKALSSERLVGKHKLEKANSLSWENNTAMGNLHRDKAKALNEVALAQERETLLLVETTELQRQQADLETKLANLKRVTREMVEPRIMGLNREITDLGEAIASDRNIGLALAREKEAAIKYQKLD
jgi:hypothetical protein